MVASEAGGSQPTMSNCRFRNSCRAATHASFTERTTDRKYFVLCGTDHTAFLAEVMAERGVDISYRSEVSKTSVPIQSTAFQRSIGVLFKANIF